MSTYDIIEFQYIVCDHFMKNICPFSTEFPVCHINLHFTTNVIVTNKLVIAW